MLIFDPSDIRYRYIDDTSFYDDPEKKKIHISLGTTMSRTIAFEVLENAIKASEILGVDKELREEFEYTRDLLSPYQVGKYGQLQEW